MAVRAALRRVVSGLIAARVLADHYGHVTILERDVLPPGPEPRRGVPHGRHSHVLLARRREVLEHVFPGFTDELMEAGAVLADSLADLIAHIDGVYLANGRSDLRSVRLSRPMLETHIRQRLLAHARVSIRERALVQNLVADGDRVIGVRLAAPFPGELTTQLAADLVVDASGRHSRSPEWLAALGYETPGLDTIEVRISYATRLFQRRPEHLGGKVSH